MKSKEDAKKAIQDAMKELKNLEKEIDNPTTKGAVDCSCNNPGCSGSEVITYAVAVGASFAGGVS